MLRRVFKSKAQPMLGLISPFASRKRFSTNDHENKAEGSREDRRGESGHRSSVLMLGLGVSAGILSSYLWTLYRSNDQPKIEELQRKITEISFPSFPEQPTQSLVPENSQNPDENSGQTNVNSDDQILESSAKESITETLAPAIVENQPENPIEIYTRETQEFVNQYLTPLTNVKLVKINKNTPLEQRPDAVLALPILFNEQAIKAVAKMLAQLPVTAGQTPIVYYQIIQQTRDFEDLREQTGIDFKNKDNIYNTIAIYHDFLGQHMVYRLSDILNPHRRIFHDFKSIKTVHSSGDLQALISELETDELLIGLCPTDQIEVRKRFGELLFKNYNLDINKVIATDIRENVIVAECQSNALVALLKSKGFEGGKAFQNPTTEVINIIGLESKSVQEITSELGHAINDRLVFKNNIVNVLPKRYRIEITIDANSQDKKELEKMKALFREVKKKLGDRAQEFEFVLNRRTIQNSEKNRRPVFGFDTELIQKQMQYFFQNTDSETAEQMKKEDPRVASLLEQQYEYSFSSLTTSNVVEFCHQLLENGAKSAKISQKAPDFQKYSRRVVGKDFRENIIENDKDQVIFYYSKNCGSCKRFLPLFEELAYENLKFKDSPTEFNRINNDENQNPLQEVYVSTPKIVIYRKGLKQKPYEYRSSMLNKTMLAQFIGITLGFDVISATDPLHQLAGGSAAFIKDSAKAQLADL